MEEKDINKIEEEVSQEVSQQDKTHLEKMIETLTIRRDELLTKINLARYINKKSTLYDSLLVLYASVCGLIVDYRSALATLLAGGYLALVGSMNNELDVLGDVANKNAIERVISIYKK